MLHWPSLFFPSPVPPPLSLSITLPPSLSSSTSRSPSPSPFLLFSLVLPLPFSPSLPSNLLILLCLIQEPSYTPIWDLHSLLFSLSRWYLWQTSGSASLYVSTSSYPWYVNLPSLGNAHHRPHLRHIIYRGMTLLSINHCIPSTEYQPLRTQYWVPTTGYPVPSINHCVPSTEYQPLGIQCQVLSTKARVLSTRYSALSVNCSVISFKYTVPSTYYWVLATKYWVLSSWYYLLSTI